MSANEHFPLLMDDVFVFPQNDATADMIAAASKSSSSSTSAHCLSLPSLLLPFALLWVVTQIGSTVRTPRFAALPDWCDGLTVYAGGGSFDSSA